MNSKDNTTSDNGLMSTEELENLMSSIFDRLKERVTDKDMYDGNKYAYYELGNDGEVLEEDWNDVFSDYPDGTNLMFISYVNDLDTIENLAKIPIEDWNQKTKDLCEENSDDIDFVYYSETN